jgi:hypothetical protein
MLGYSEGKAAIREKDMVLWSQKRRTESSDFFITHIIWVLCNQK